VGITGREGFVGLSIVLGDTETQNSTFMQVQGTGYRVDANILRGATAQSSTLQTLLLKFAKVFLTQVTETALSNARSKIEQRLARWILMADDRIDDAALPLRHEFLALMLGVRRAGVTVAIQSLEGRGLIKASRGRIQIVDREGLIDDANGCYGMPEQEFRRLIEPS
jgi:CRP-like cAMP-binding protein